MLRPITMIVPSADTEFTATVIISGVVIVLGMLLLLIAIFYAFGLIVSNTEKAAKKKSIKKTENKMVADKMVQPVPKSAAPVRCAAPAPVVETGISPEIVVAIAAAIAMQEGPAAVVRSIRRKQVSSRNPWAAAAIADNTRPF